MTLKPSTEHGDDVPRSATTSPIEQGAMRRAIVLSALGLGSTSPNPPVGCVILDSAGRQVGEGYHERKGEPHAEVHSLMAAGDKAVGGTAAVTLEPCNHHGRTPPCHQALLDAGIQRVLIAILDPTSRGEGGAVRLREAGVDVEIGVLADEARLVLGPWLRGIRERRPSVTWAYRLGPDEQDGVGASIGAPWLRRRFDAVLSGGAEVEEGLAGSHGVGVFRIPEVVPTAAPGVMLLSLYDGGVRSLLLDGGPSVAAPYLDAGLIDEVVAFVDHVPSSGQMSVRLLDGPSLVPPGFVVQRLTKVDHSVVVEASRVPAATAG